MDIVTTSNFHASLLPDRLHVLSIPASDRKNATWSLLNLILFRGNTNNEATPTSSPDKESTSHVFSIISEADGITLFINERVSKSLFNNDKNFRLAPQVWRAIKIHLGPMGAEFPNVINFLSNFLAAENISILNMSTFDTDIIFVQDCDTNAAVTALQSKLARGLHGLIEQRVTTKVASPLSPAAVLSQSLFLTVIPSKLKMIRIQKSHRREVALALTQVLMFSDFWSYSETTDDEISLLLEEKYLGDFLRLPGAVIVSPESWRGVKLCGKLIGFEETGVVAAMTTSEFGNNSLVLNMSTYDANVALVMEDDLENAIDMICNTLSIKTVIR